CLAERLSMHVGGKADNALHVVTVDLAKSGAVIDSGHVRHQRPSRPFAVSRHHRQVGEVLDGSHLRLRNLDLNLKSISARWIAPEVEVRVSARRSGGRERPADIRGRHAELAGTVAVDLNLQRWVIERLRVLEIA